MYLMSLYFDKETEALLQKHMERVAKGTGNFYMLDNRIPPHITIASCGNVQEHKLLTEMEPVVRTWRQEKIDWVAIGSFKPHVLFLTPVLNGCLHEMCVSANEVIDKICEEKMPTRYQPFRWLPHTAIARTLTEKQMLEGFHVMQANFTPFSGKVTEVGIARSNPYQDIKRWFLTHRDLLED